MILKLQVSRMMPSWGCSLAGETGDAGALGAVRVQVAGDELDVELLVAAGILACRVLVLRHDLVEGAQAGGDVLRSIVTLVNILTSRLPKCPAPLTMLTPRLLQGVCTAYHAVTEYVRASMPLAQS